MAERFFVPSLGTDDAIELTGDEAHHLARVCRIGPGEQIQLFDGSGIECDAIVRGISKHGVEISVTRRHHIDRELPFALTLACSPPKGDRLRWLVEKATELGVTRFVPLITEYATEQARGLGPEKLRRWVIESSKQCGRNVLMDVTDPLRWTDFLEFASSGLRLVAHPRGVRMSAGIIAGAKNGAVIAVGPEGGFTDQEQEIATSRGWTAVRLGPRILRSETAALALLARLTGGE